MKHLIKSDPLNAIVTHLEGEPGKTNDSELHEARITLEAAKQRLPDDDDDDGIFLRNSAKHEVVTALFLFLRISDFLPFN